MKVKDLRPGCIIWCGDEIVGITGATVPEELNDFEVKPVFGNEFDWELQAVKSKSGGYIKILNQLFTK